MDILAESPGVGYKLCEKKLHWYIPGRGCPKCRNTRVLKKYHKDQKAGRAWYQKNKQKHIESGRKSYFENAEERKLRWKEWRKNNLEYDKNRNAEYGKRKPEIIRAKQARRRATCKAQLPSWACIQKIKNVYKYAKQLEIETGVKMHVDHIYPLKSNYMCGLHVENNLQIILASENCSKGNRIWPGQLDCQKGPVSAIFPKELLALLND
jgi:hypothetical protein